MGHLCRCRCRRGPRCHRRCQRYHHRGCLCRSRPRCKPQPRTVPLQPIGPRRETRTVSLQTASEVDPSEDAESHFPTVGVHREESFLISEVPAASPSPRTRMSESPLWVVHPHVGQRKPSRQRAREQWVRFLSRGSLGLRALWLQSSPSTHCTRATRSRRPRECDLELLGRFGV